MMYTGSFMKLQGLSRFAASSSLVLMGAVVMMTSLQSQHVRSTFAADTHLPLHSQTAGKGVSRFFDRRMPGALPYLLERGQDRMNVISSSPEDQPRVLLQLSQERAEAAAYAFSHGDESLAMTTLSKGFVYLHRAVALCQQQGADCQASDEQFMIVGESLKKVCVRVHETASAQDVRSRAQALCSELEALLSSFISTT